MKRIKKALYLAIIAIMSVFFAHTALGANIKVFYNGTEIIYDVPPQIVHERTMVPIRATIETITGAPMEWNASTKTVTFRANGHTNVHTIGQSVVYVDGSPVSFDTPSLIIDSRTLVPVRMIAETSGCKVDWDQANRYVIITQQQVTPTPSAAASIYSVTASKTTVIAGESTEITVKTNSAANAVWIDDGYSTVNAAYKSTDASGTKTWTLTTNPSSSRNYTVYANTSQSSANAVKQTLHITVNSASARINSVTANRTTITRGDSITFTIKTTQDANYVWLDYDGTYKNATYQSISGSVKTWTVSINPVESQRVTAYAHASSRTVSGADYQTQSITVNEVVTTTAKITSAYANPTTVNNGDTVTITATTNTAAAHAWVDTGYNTASMTLAASNSSSKTWTYSYYPTDSGRIYVYAGRYSQTQEDDAYVDITVRNTEDNPEIISVSVDPGEVSVLPEEEMNNTFVIVTNSSVEEVSLEYFGFSNPVTIYSSVLVSQGNKRWTTTVPVHTDGRTTNYFDITIRAFDQYGNTASSKARIYIRS